MVGLMGEPVTIDHLLEQARAAIDRLTPSGALAAQQAGALIVDIRPLEQRRRDGEIPGALVVDRNVLEWRLAPAARGGPPPAPAPAPVLASRPRPLSRPS